MKHFQSRHFLLEARLRRDKIADAGAYPFCLPVIRQFESLQFHPAVTFIIGENGSGKSTLLEALAVALGFNAEGGSKNFNFATRASHSSLHEALRLVKGVRRPRTGFFLRAESYFNVATHIEKLDEQPAPGPPIIDSFGGRSLHAQSHGESFMALLLHRFGPEGLYLLDEPEAALSPTRQLAMLARMHELVRQGSQFIIATHAPILLAYPDAVIFEISATGLAETPYTATEHYRVTRDFLNNPEKTLKLLLSEA